MWGKSFLVSLYIPYVTCMPFIPFPHSLPPYTANSQEWARMGLAHQICQWVHPKFNLMNCRHVLSVYTSYVYDKMLLVPVDIRNTVFPCRKVCSFCAWCKLVSTCQEIAYSHSPKQHHVLAPSSLFDAESVNSSLYSLDTVLCQMSSFLFLFSSLHSRRPSTLMWTLKLYGSGAMEAAQECMVQLLIRRLRSVNSFFTFY